MEGSSCSNPGEELPYTSHVHFYAPNIVTIKLSGQDTYDVWKTQMLCLLESHDMLGFIESILVNHNDKSWRRSDALVKGWILGSLSEQVLKLVVKLVKTNKVITSKDVWDKLQTIYAPPLQQHTAIEQETEEGEEVKVKEKAAIELYSATLRQDFESIEKILNEKHVTLRDKITINGDTALHVAVGTTKNVAFLEKMLERATRDSPQQPLDMQNSEGNTLLHVAAIIGNIVAADILLKRNPDFLSYKDNKGQIPLFIALFDKTTYPYWLMRYIPGVNLIKNEFFWMISGGFPEIPTDVTDDPDVRHLSTLMALAQNFPPKLNFWRRKFRNIRNSLAINCMGVYTAHYYAKDLLYEICRDIKIWKSPTYQHRYYNNAILEATKQDAYKFVKIIVSNIPNAIWSANEEGHNIIQYAVINRSKNTYNLLYQMSEHRNYYKTIKDPIGNNLLHLVARLAPTSKLDPISGAALQIQYELQWFKEVEGFVSPICIRQKNLFDETPQMVFTREHKNLVLDGEKWMKTTAESYTITAALITTIAFAAAITVPGGNKQDNGIPVFTNKTAFTVFAISDAVSLFTSVTSLLMFLSILTARFAEQDFLFRLPTKLIIGLAALFISTTAMLIAFGATLFLVFCHGNSMILVPIGLLTSLPIACFITLQFPLVYDLMSSTYGPSKFGKKWKIFIYDLVNTICGRKIFGKKKRPPFY